MEDPNRSSGAEEVLKRTHNLSWRYGFRLMRDPTSVLREHNTAQEMYK